MLSGRKFEIEIGIEIDKGKDGKNKVGPGVCNSKRSQRFKRVQRAKRYIRGAEIFIGCYYINF